MNTEITKDALTQLIGRLHARDSGSDLQLSPETRDDVTKALESCLADRQLLKLYMSVLESALGGHARHNGVFEVESLENLSQSGLGGLDEGALFCLALDPASLWCLHDIIVEEGSQYWERFRNVGIAASPDRTDCLELAEDGRRERGRIAWTELDCLSEPGFSELLETLCDNAKLSSVPSMGDRESATAHPTTLAGDPAYVQPLGPTTMPTDIQQRLRLLAAKESAAPRWTWLDDLRAWLLAIPEATLKLAPIMSDDATDLEAVIETPPTIRESCPWADALKIHRSAAVLTIQALGPKVPGSTSSLKVWVAERPEQAEVLANDQRIGFLDTSEGEPRLLLAVRRKEQPSWPEPR